MTSRARLRPGAVAALAALIAVAACASVPDDDAAPSSTTSARGAAEVDAADPGSAASPSSSTTVAPAPARPVDPLTGLDSALEAARPALVVKIDNHDRARPQHGLNEADIVFEEIVEGGLTRFAAVFHSTDADPVGPIRSVRTSDFPVLANLAQPLFANSGGNDNVLALLGSVESIDVSSNAAGDAYYRDDDRPAPHNLLSDTGALWAAGAARGAVGSPPALLTYRSSPASPLGSTDVGVRITYGATEVEYVWDESAQRWARGQNGTPHVDAAGDQVAPTNVIVQVIAYGRTADGRSPEARLLGSGPAWFLVSGEVVEGTWERALDGDVTTYLDAEGELMEFVPGSTWIALPRVGQVAVLG